MSLFAFLQISTLFLLQQVHGEDPEPAIRVVDGTIELGYCFGVDYIVVFKSGPEGDQLLGNSSEPSEPFAPPAHLRGRIHINNHNHLLGLQIRQLTHLDSGIYRRECWQNHTRVAHHSQLLVVCDDEMEAQKVIADERGGQTELRCNSTCRVTEGMSVRWYYDIQQSNRFQLFLDTSVSLEPLASELQGAVMVKDNGTLLLLDNTLMKQRQQFYCVVMDGIECRSSQNMYQPVHSERRTIFASVGDKVEMICPFESDNQLWETPLGNLNVSNVRDNQMYISDKDKDYSLVIPVVSDEHSGEYSCVAATLDLQYSLSLCPRSQPEEKVCTEGAKVLLECDINQEDPKRVLWFRQDSAGNNKLILDSSDETIEVPEDLRGRMSLSEGKFSLTLSNVDMKDGVVYWCVALGETDSADFDYDYVDDYEDENTEYGDGQYWYQTPKCILKQENKLILAGKSSSTSEFVIVAVAMVIVVVGLVVAAIVMKRMKNIQTRKQVTTRSRGRKNKDVKLSVDPECTEKLNPV
ncbi:uncharacterized protein LOC144054207 isoform X2 [Vanacampus margaritifer]